MSTTTNGKTVSICLNAAKTGVEVRVGQGVLMPRVTLSPEIVASAARLLGVKTGSDGESAAKWIEAVKNAEAEGKRCADIGLNRGTQITNLRIELDAAQKEIDHLRGELDLTADLSEKIERIITERDEARNLRDAAVRVAKTWEDAAARNLDDLNAAKRDLTTLQANFDALNDEFKAEKRARHSADLAHAAELHRAKALGWLYFGALFVCGALGFISLVVKGGR
jgi:DNA repair ATPase RecN